MEELQKYIDCESYRYMFKRFRSVEKMLDFYIGLYNCSPEEVKNYVGIPHCKGALVYEGDPCYSAYFFNIKDIKAKSERCIFNAKGTTYNNFDFFIDAGDEKTVYFVHSEVC